MGPNRGFIAGSDFVAEGGARVARSYVELAPNRTHVPGPAHGDASGDAATRSST
jgi:hypothetical protein